MPRFAGCVVLVTGGSSGIGFATAKAFLKEGAKVAVTGRNAARLGRAARELRTSGRVLTIRGDVSKALDAKRFVARTEAAFGPIDVLVNNAGIYLEMSTEVLTEREWDAVLDISLKGTFLCTKYALPGMIRRKRGISSTWRPTRASWRHPWLPPIVRRRVGWSFSLAYSRLTTRKTAFG